MDVEIGVGDLCKSMYEAAARVENSGQSVYYFADRDAMLGELEGLLQDKDTVLVKASHGMHFEEVVACL